MVVVLQMKRTNRRNKSARVLAAGVAALVLAMAPGAVMADDAKVMAKEAGVGAASAVASLLYGPAKLAYAAGGLIVGEAYTAAAL